MGEVRAEHEVARALDRLSNRLSQVARLRKGGDMAVLTVRSVPWCGMRR